ncbi:MAG: chorismate synthase [Campylobacterales bacterium]|nr:chorismate synthase [Campylobacterales bacterium]
MNSFGQRFTLTTFGESHGTAIGCILDGVPAGLEFDEKFIQSELDRRKPGKSKFETPRKEDDKIEILSGVFEGKTTGTSISMVIYNNNQKSKDYSNVKDLFRPGHGDFTYFHKYGIRDYRGGGRSSARETAARVAGGAVAKLLLKQVGIEVFSGIRSIGNIVSEKTDFDFAKESLICSLDPIKEEAQKDLIEKVRKDHNSIGGSVFVKIKNTPKGLGEPMYNKLDGALAEAMMGINAVKAVEIGEGKDSVFLTGYENNDQIRSDGFLTNHAGGILAGISNGDDIDINIYFKPTPSIFKELKTVDKNNKNADFLLKGRHDPCVAIRGSVVCESMAALVIADMLLLNMSSKLENIKKVYN